MVLEAKPAVPAVAVAQFAIHVVSLVVSARTLAVDENEMQLGYFRAYVSVPIKRVYVLESSLEKALVRGSCGGSDCINCYICRDVSCGNGWWITLEAPWALLSLGNLLFFSLL